MNPAARRLARFEIAAKTLAVRLANTLGDHQIGEKLAARGGAREAEDPLRRRVELDDAAGAVDGNDRVERGGKKRRSDCPTVVSSRRLASG